MKIGVGVEGPSDREFWDKVLHKHFRGVHFHIRIMGGRPSLIRETPRLLNTFRDAHYDAGFILIDRDDAQCPPAVVDEFDPAIQIEARKPADQRYLFICVAIRELEAWLLADEPAIVALLPNANYKAPTETAPLNAKARILELLRAQHGRQVGYNEIEFAKRVAPKFNPDEATKRSKSLAYFWERMSTRLQSG